MLPVPQKRSPQKEARKFDQHEFSRVDSRRGYQKLHWAPCYCWGAENCWLDGHCWVRIQTKWKNTPWTCFQNLANGVSKIKTRGQESISTRPEVCSAQWLQCAKEVLRLNRTDNFQFLTSIKDLLIHSRSKNRNVIITGPTNPFMLKPLKLLFSDSMSMIWKSVFAQRF